MSPDPFLLNDLVAQFAAAANGWASAFYPIALRLFYLLALFEIVYMGLRMVLSSTTYAGIADALVRKMIHLGFCFLLVSSAPFYTRVLIEGFQAVGAAGTGVTALHPNVFFTTGIGAAMRLAASTNIAGLLFNQFSFWTTIFAIYVIVIAFTIMTAVLIFTLVESYVLMGISPFFLAFSTSRWTYSIAEGFLSHVIRVGVKLLTLYLIAGIVNNLATVWAQRLLDGKNDIFATLAFCGAICVLATLVVGIPRLAASLVPSHIDLGLKPAPVGGQ